MANEWILFVCTFIGIINFHNLRHEIAHRHQMATYLSEQYRRGRFLDKAGYSPLMNAIASGDKQRAISLMNLVSVHQTSDAGYTALHVASYNGMENLARMMLDHGADVNAQAEDGSTPLLLGVSTNRTGVLKLLTDFGAKVNLANKNGTTALMLAVSNGYADIVRILTDQENPKQLMQEDIEAAFQLAARQGDIRVGFHLLKIVKNTGESYTKPLFLAVFGGRLNFVEFLLKAGTPCDSRDLNGRTALHLAVEKRDLNLVKLLFQYKCDSNAKDVMKTTPLHVAAAVGDLRIASLLVRHGANKEAKTKFGDTPISIAVRLGHVRTYRLFRMVE